MLTVSFASVVRIAGHVIVTYDLAMLRPDDPRCLPVEQLRPVPSVTALGATGEGLAAGYWPARVSLVASMRACLVREVQAPPLKDESPQLANRTRQQRRQARGELLRAQIALGGRYLRRACRMFPREGPPGQVHQTKAQGLDVICWFEAAGSFVRREARKERRPCRLDTQFGVAVRGDATREPKVDEVHLQSAPARISLSCPRVCPRALVPMPMPTTVCACGRVWVRDLPTWELRDPTPASAPTGLSWSIPMQKLLGLTSLCTSPAACSRCRQSSMR